MPKQSLVSASQSIELIPELTQRIAKAAFPKGNVYLTMPQELGTLFTDEDFTAENGLWPIQ